MSIVVSELKHLEQFGFDLLTGEACGLGYRILCDVTEEGRKTVQNCLGIGENNPLAPPWNTGFASAPHVGSFLLSPEMMIPLGVFGCVARKCTAVYIVTHMKEGQPVGSPFVYAPQTNEDAEEVRTMIETCKSWKILRKFAPKGDAWGGMRNVHQMSGRVL